MKHRRLTQLLSLLLLLSLAACTVPAASTPTPTAPVLPVPGQSWPTSSPEQQGMDSAKLADMFDHLVAENIRMHSLLVIRNGYLVLEAYFDPYTSATPHQIASITKSVMGALVGIAIDQGKIKSVDEPVLSFFPGRQIANLTPAKQAMTLADLLTLSPGLDCSDIQGTEGQMMASPDWVQFVLDLPTANDPGQKWTYCSSAVHLVSAILQQATGMDARTFANQYLFAPIGIAAVPPERWYADPQGISGGGNGLLLTPAEVARFAYLYLNHGRWGDRQVVPAAWVDASLTPHIAVGKMKEYGDMNRSYGYLWSLYPEQKFFSALGRNGQHIHVFPEENLVVVFTSATPVVSDERQFTLLKEYILPAVQSKTALPENSAASARLTAAVEQAARPIQPLASLPEIAQQLNGRTIWVEDAVFGWETAAFTFTPGSDTAQISFSNGLQTPVGLDNLYRVVEIPGLGQVGSKAAWNSQGHLVIRQIFIGGWTELEIEVKVDGDNVTIFQRNVIDGGNIVYAKGRLE